MEKVRDVETGIAGNSPDDFPATLLPDLKGITMEEREAKYENWKKATLIAKVAILEKQIEDDDIANREAQARSAQKISCLEAAYNDLKELLYFVQAERDELFDRTRTLERQKERTESKPGCRQMSISSSEILPAFDPRLIFYHTDNEDGSMRTSLL